MIRRVRKKSHRGPGKKRQRSRSRSLTPNSPSPQPAEFETKAVPETRTVSEAEPEAQPISEPETESEGEHEARPETESEPGLESKSESEPESEPDTESVVGIKLEDELDSKRMEGDMKKMKNIGTSETKKAVYLFFETRCVPYNYTLYAVDLPNNLNDASLDLGPINLSPVLAFEEDKYPDHMSCVEVEGRLYFVGGNRADLRRDVYIFDPLTASLDKPLAKGPTMNTGKCNPFAFVVGRDIYVLSNRKLPTVSMFEVLRADASGHYAQWEILKDPPFHGGLIAGHVVIGNKLLISNKWEHRYYDTVSGEWSDDFEASYVLWYKAHFVDSHVYTCPSPYAVLSHNLHTNEDSYQSGAMWSLNVFHDSVRLQRPLHCLAYIGGGCFCHVLSGPREDPLFPDLEFRESKFLGLTIFKAFTETYSDDKNRKCFPLDPLHCMHFAVDNMEPCVFFLIDSFVLPSCGVEQNLDEMEVKDRKKMIFSRIAICKELKLQLGLSQS